MLSVAWQLHIFQIDTCVFFTGPDERRQKALVLVEGQFNDGVIYGKVNALKRKCS